MGAFRDLASLLLNLTVLDPTSHVRLAYREGESDRAVLGGATGPTDPLRLTDGSFLRVSIAVFVDRDDDRGSSFMKVRESSFQHQLDEEGHEWTFRYDYLREPGPDPHPTAHLQVNGKLPSDVLPAGMPLGRIHFPTGRVALEGIIRLLTEQFGVPAREPSDVWRAALAESERAFLEIAHVPHSGPAR